MNQTRTGKQRRPKSLLSVDEAAILLETTRSTAYRALSKGTFPLPVIRLGGRLRIPRAAVDRLLAGACPPPASNSVSGSSLAKS
ncbi:excisionase family DNA-binding protein [Ferrimicrobium acidiphilum]|uniref:excisionase family DNA-binding protein n=1 Tax=Ferrimicrobium acidiphilum TaxID=121039 RepID=UPI003C6D69DE